MNRFDAIIIGGGLGGLSAGAKLAKDGKKVLLIEQHKVPGGCATTFDRKGYKMEVSLHEMDGLDEMDVKGKIFEELDVLGNVEFIKVPEFYRVVNKSTDIVIPDNTSDAIKILKEEFPEEKRGINKFFKIIHSIRREVHRLPTEKWKMILLFPVFPLIYPNVVKSNNKTLGGFLDSITKNDKLKLILTANIGYYHFNCCH